MKKFFGEFKKFITRGNVVDMAVGVIVGSSFTAIVNSLSNNILKPLINFLLTLIFGANSLSEVFTFLKRVDDATGAPDLTQSIYIDWGAFINAVINFFLVAFVLFSIVKIINGVREKHVEFTNELGKLKATKEEKKELKAMGKRPHDIEALRALREEKKRVADEAAELEKQKAEEEERLAKEKAEYLAATDERMELLLREIRDLLKNK